MLRRCPVKNYLVYFIFYSPRRHEGHEVALVPNLQIGNAVLEAPASRLAKLELRLLGSQTGALIVIHKSVQERHFDMDAGMADSDAG